MKRNSTWLVIGCAAWICAGCGKQSEVERSRFNESLGAGPAGAPTTVGSIDESINKDLTGYKPAGMPASGGSASATDAAKGSGGFVYAPGNAVALWR